MPTISFCIFLRRISFSTLTLCTCGRLLLSVFLLSFLSNFSSGTSAYWSFQTDQAGGTYSSVVTLSDFPNGNPTLSATGSSLANLNNFGPAYTASDGSVWQPGKALAWNGQNGSTGNTMQVNLNASQLKDFSLRFKFRNNQTRSSGNLVNAFSSFQYNIGNGYIAIPSANLSIPNNTSWNCLLYTSPSPRDVEESRMPSSA